MARDGKECVDIEHQPAHLASLLKVLPPNGTAVRDAPNRLHRRPRPAAHAVIVKTPPVNCVEYWRRGAGAGPPSTRPLTSKVEPWHGHT